MPLRRSTVILGVLGMVLIALSAVVHFVVVPVATKLPGSTKLDVQYAGTATMLDSAALQSGDAAHALAQDVPITVDRSVKVTKVVGDTAVVADNITIHAGTQDLPSPHSYALDRTTLEGATAPASVTVEPSKGALSSAFPLGVKAADVYKFYDSTTQSIVPIDYKDDGTVQGRAVHIYDIAADGPVKDAGLLKMLPPALPKSLLATLVPLLPDSVKAQVTPETLAALPDPIPLTYTGSTNITAWVDTQTGLPVNQKIAQQVVVGVAAGSQTLSLMPVLDLNFEVTPDSQAKLADKASSSGRLLTLIKGVVPLVLLVLGLAGLAASAMLQRRRPRAD